MDSADSGLVRAMTADDLEQVLAWRNHPSIRRNMLTQNEILLDDHRRWFERASQDHSRQLLLFEHGGKALGFVQFTGSRPQSIADWGFYAAPDAPKGTGRKLGQAALRFAFESVGVHKVCGQALDFNTASIQFHAALGFQQEGVLREQHLLADSYHDLLCFGLLHREWSAMQRE